MTYICFIATSDDDECPFSGGGEIEDNSVMMHVSDAILCVDDPQLYILC